MLWPDPGHLADAGFGGWRWAVAGTDRGSPKFAAPFVLGRGRDGDYLMGLFCGGRHIETHRTPAEREKAQTTHANTKRVQD